MGTRKEVAEHELLCQNVPIEVLRTKLEDSERTKNELEGSNANLHHEIFRIQRREMAARQSYMREILEGKKRESAAVRNHEDAILNYEWEKNRLHTAQKNEIAAAAWKAPIEILKSANNNLFNCIIFF